LFCCICGCFFPAPFVFFEVVLICWKLAAQWGLIGLLLWALNPFKMILFWGLKKIPLLLKIPALKDHLTAEGGLENIQHHRVTLPEPLPDDQPNAEECSATTSDTFAHFRVLGV
jgi:hypothetical protein